MNRFKKLPMALTVVGLGAAASFAEIKLTDNLSTTGFIDMSANGMAPDSGDASLNASLDQFEMDFMYKFGDKVSARADVNAGAAGGVSVEQANVTATMGALSVTSGRFLSAMGFEAAEPTGMYQYSASKTTVGVYGGYQNGVNVAWTSPMFGLYASVVTDLWAPNAQEFDLINSPGFEGQVSVMPVEGVTAKAAFLYQMYDKDNPLTLGDENQSLLNVWAQYAKGAITAAAEFNMLMSWKVGAADDLSGMGWLVMANYKITDLIAATVRYSALTIDDEIDATDDMDSEVTFSPSFAIAPNWLALAEVRYELDGPSDAQTGFAYALETTFSF